MSALLGWRKASPVFSSPQVKAELHKQWSRFLLAEPFGRKLCFLGQNIKYLRRCSQKEKKEHLSSNHLCLEVSEPWGMKLQQLLAKQRAVPCTEQGCALPPRLRASVSDSSEGEVTTGETTEEVVFEESEI